MLHYEDQVQALRKHDFTYLPPGVKHSISNNADQALRVLVMGFKIPSSISIGAPMLHPKVANLEDAKEETVSGHPNSVLYKLLAGLHTGKRDLIDEAYVMDSFFWMDFTPGGTNWPHHHEFAEEIYLVIDGQGEMVAGSGLDGVAGRYPAKPGDAYYFRPNCTVGFYNQDKPGAKAYILAVRARVPLHDHSLLAPGRALLRRQACPGGEMAADSNIAGSISTANVKAIIGPTPGIVTRR